MARVLLIEDDLETAAEILADFTAGGHLIEHAADGERGLARAETSSFDALVVDRLLPKLDGLSLVEQLRSQAITTPVLILSALDAVDERIRGLRAGGDDYLTKPFALAELTARVEALLRRPAEIRATSLDIADLTLDLIDHVAYRGTRRIELLPREYVLLEYLMRRPGRLVTRRMLLEDLWGYRHALQTNVVDVHLGKLRRKIDAAGEPLLLHSVRGAGFMLGPSD